MSKNFSLGKIGEELAAKYLQKHGYKIIERNFKKRYGEIDIVAQEGETLVFVEVKTRYSFDFVSPQNSVTPWKLKTLKRSALYYKMLHPELPENLRVDFVGVVMESGGQAKEIKLIKNIIDW